MMQESIERLQSLLLQLCLAPKISARKAVAYTGNGCWRVKIIWSRRLVSFAEGIISRVS